MTMHAAPMRLYFPMAPIRRLLERPSTGRLIWCVGEGVYITRSGPERHAWIFADGLNPAIDRDWQPRQWDAFAHERFAEIIPRQLLTMALRGFPGAHTLVLEIRVHETSVHLAGPAQRVPRARAQTAQETSLGSLRG